MSRKLAYLALVIGLAVALGVSSAAAQKIVTNLGANDLTTVTPEDPSLGDFYVLDVDVPQGLTVSNLHLAVLELRLDVASTDQAESTPVLEVYALNSAFTGTLNPEQFAPLTTPLHHNVAVGANRKMMLDITEIVKSYLETPSQNHGLVIGSLTGDRNGLFSIKSNALAPRIVARVVFLHGGP
jgi:hypothetical protein